MKQLGLKGSVALIVVIPLSIVTVCAIVYNYNLDVGTEPENTAYTEPVFTVEPTDLPKPEETTPLPVVTQEDIVKEAPISPEETTYVEPEYQEYVSYVENTYGVASGDAAYFQQMGVMSYDDWRVTYYNPASMGTSHENLGYYTVGQGIYDRGDGIGVTSDGYIAVAMPEDVPYGTVVETPFGTGICVDHSGGAMDVVVYF